MASRHRMRSGDWESVFGRLEELVLANSGEDEFEEIFKILIAKLFDELVNQGHAEFGVGESAGATATRIQDLLIAAQARWDGIFEGPPVSRLTDEHLAICVEALEPYSLLDTNLEVLDGLFEHLVSKSSKGSKGQYFTPRHVVDFCVRVLSPKSTESVVDPACGSGGFLIHALTYQRESEGTPKLTGGGLWGFDFDARSIQVAKALMLIAGGDEANLYRLNSLLTPRGSLTLLESSDRDTTTPRVSIEDVVRSRARRHQGFDVVLTNPPFAGEIRERHVLDTYDLATRKSSMERDVLFLERCVQLLKPGGRMAIVLPHNKFASPTWAYAREWMLRRLKVVAVVGLGRNTFMPHTSQKTSVLFGIKRDGTLRVVPADESVLFAVSEKDGKDSRGRVIDRSDSRPDEPTWLRADHDLDQVASSLQSYLRGREISWESR